MKIKQIKYNLVQSPIAEINEEFIDIKVDLKLSTNKDKINIGSSILGQVKDHLNNPIKGAMVKLIDYEFNLLTYIFTDDEGKYRIDIIPYSENYAIIVIFVGKLSLKSKFFNLNQGEEKIFDFILIEDKSLDFGVINGVIKDKNDFNYIAGSVVWLYKLINNEKILMTITYSDKNGEFLFCKLLPGIYSIVVFNVSYFSEEILKEINVGEISTITILLKYNLNSPKSIISGVITDEKNLRLSEANVTLYKVENNKAIPIAFTVTNTDGVYTFINIPKGNYIVKSNKTQEIISEYNSISSIFTATTTIPINSKVYDITSATVSGLAKLDKNTNFIVGIGGKDNGSALVSLKLDNMGIYKLAIQYIASDANRPLKIDINGINTGTIYSLLKTNSNKISDANVFTLPNDIELNLNNAIKFYGDGKNNSPDLGKLFLNLVTYIFKLSEGQLAKGAKLDEDSKLIDWVGGEIDGNVTIIANVNYTGIYKMAIKYISSDGSSPFKIDVNGVNTGSIYIPPETSGWSIVDASLFTIPNAINLNLGSNKIKFYGDGKNFAPSLGHAYITLSSITSSTNTLPIKTPISNTIPTTQTIPDKLNSSNTLPIVATIPALYSYNAINGTLAEGAKIDSVTKFVTGLGGKVDGSTTLTVSVDRDGNYNLFGIYLSPNTDRSLKLDINKITIDYIYQLPMTKGKTLSDVKIFIIVIELKAGNNTIKFHGDGINLAPDLGTMILFTNDLEKKEPVLQYYINEKFG